MTREEAIKHYEATIANHQHLMELAAETPKVLELVKICCEAEVMALAALREQEERDKQPLTLAELRKMHKETVYCLDLNADVVVTAPNVGHIFVSYNFPGDSGTIYARSLTLYRKKPKEE